MPSILAFKVRHTFIRIIDRAKRHYQIKFYKNMTSCFHVFLAFTLKYRNMDLKNGK